jgi:hypothetical protein
VRKLQAFLYFQKGTIMEDVFVNAGLLYEEIGLALRNATLKASQAHMYAEMVYKNKWLPEEIRTIQKMSLDGASDVLDILTELRDTLENKKKVRKRVVINEDRKRIERITVIHGGL